MIIFLKIPSDSISKYVILNIFLGGIPQIPHH